MAERAHTRATPSRGAVREELGRILRSRAFSSAPRLTRLLSHLVEESLAGRPEALKEYALGVDVFDRGESFDPATDTIVRVQARRLRSKLSEYYAGEGRGDPVAIEIPKGAYVAEFRPASPLGPEAPEPARADRHERAWTSRSLSLPLPPPLPAARTPLIGRAEERAELEQILRDPGVRLLTLTGAGGTGKTRLALEVTSDVRGAFPGGAYFIGLASLADASGLAAALAHALGPRQIGARAPGQTLCDHLRRVVREPTLLVLDNFEHLLAAAPLVAGLLDATPLLQVLVASRSVLHLYGEHEYRLRPLLPPDPAHPQPLRELSRNPAVALFVERVRAAQPDFELTRECAAPVAEICWRLDGLPLALELAAARVKTLPLESILERLDRPLTLLANGAADLPARQRTMRRTVDWSHGLLSEAERRLFRRLSVFVGGCSLDSAEAVADTRRDLGVDVLDGVASLVDHSLLLPREDAEGGRRFGMLEPIREYALERLRESGEAEQIARAHAAYCLVRAQEGNRPLSPEERAAWLAGCDAELDNHRAALDWLIARDEGDWALRLALSLYPYWDAREQLLEARQRLEAVLALPGAAARTRARARTLMYVGALAEHQGDLDAMLLLGPEAIEIFDELGDTRGKISVQTTIAATQRFRGDYEAARAGFEATLEACRELDEPAETAAALCNLAGVVSAQGDQDHAHRLLEEALGLFAGIGYHRGVAWGKNLLGDVARARGDLAEAQRLYQESAEALRGLGDPWAEARSLTDLGALLCDAGDLEAARSHLQSALRIFADVGHGRGVAKVLEAFAGLAGREGQPERALRLAGAVASLREILGALPRSVDHAALDDLLRSARRAAGSRAGPAWEAGRRMHAEQAIREALEEGATGAWMPTRS